MLFCEADTRQIWLMNSDGSNLRQLTSGLADSGNPAWLPDGSQIVFASNRTGNFDIYLVSADGSGQPQNLTQTPPMSSTQPGRIGMTCWPFVPTRTGAIKSMWSRPMAADCAGSCSPKPTTINRPGHPMGVKLPSSRTGCLVRRAAGVANPHPRMRCIFLIWKHGQPSWLTAKEELNFVIPVGSPAMNDPKWPSHSAGSRGSP